MKSEPLISAVSKARSDYKKTRAGKLEELLKEGRKWSRRRTIADNKHAAAIGAVIDYAAELAAELDKREGGMHERKP